MKRNDFPKPFWLRTGIGPGTIATIALLSFVLWQRWQQTQTVPTMPSPPVWAEHTLPPLAREPKWLLERADDLGLTEEQKRKLKALQRDYEQRTATLRRQLDEASEAFQRFMNEAQRRGGLTSVGEIQRQAAEMSRLSRALAEQRYAVWEQALSVLTEKQRRKINE